MPWLSTSPSYHLQKPSTTPVQTSNTSLVGLGLILDEDFVHNFDFEDSNAPNNTLEIPRSLSTSSEAWNDISRSPFTLDSNSWTTKSGTESTENSIVTLPYYPDATSTSMMPTWEELEPEAFASNPIYQPQNMSQSFPQDHLQFSTSMDGKTIWPTSRPPAEVHPYHYHHLPSQNSTRLNQRYWDRSSVGSHGSGSRDSYLSSTSQRVRKLRSDSERPGNSRQKGKHRKDLPKVEKSFSCLHCGVVFDRRRDLNDHAKTHDQNRKPVPCPMEGCTRTYGRKADLTRHIKSFHEKETYPCEHCQKVFNRSDLRARHYDICPLNPDKPKPVTSSSRTTEVEPVWSRDTEEYTFEAQPHNESSRTLGSQHTYERDNGRRSRDPTYFTNPSDVYYC